MKTILSSRKYPYWKRVGIFLIVITLVVGLVACNGDGGGAQYDFTIAVAPPGSGTATDLTNASPYGAGTVVVIEAEAAAGYQFVSWTAPAGTFVNANAVQTTFTMPAQNVTVTANFVAVYDLTMAVNPVGGGTATDLTNALPYAEGTGVSIKAVAAAGYQFVSWTAPAGTFANANAAQTTFTMPAQNVTVTAHFVGPPDHFTYYSVDSKWYIGQNVTLEDQFGTLNATVEWAMGFGNPAEKWHGENVTPIWNPDHHFTLYSLSYEGGPQTWFVEVNNQFGTQNLTVTGPIALAVPTQKEGHEPPVRLDHYLLYSVNTGPLVEEVVALNDQFGDQPEVWVYEPFLFANPVQKTHGDTVTEIVNPEVHAVIYSIAGEYFETEVQVINQFGEQTLDVYGPDLLAVPSEKTSAERLLPVAAVLGDDYNARLTNLLLANGIVAEERGWDITSDIGDYSVVVVNFPGHDPAFLDFLDAASDNGVGVVFTCSSTTSMGWGISLLQTYLSDPAMQDESRWPYDVYYKVTQAHPIFDGWNVGDEITIITGGYNAYSWFWGYSGDTIAEVGNVFSGIAGDAVAVGTYGGSTHVLLASSGSEVDTDVRTWTNDHKTIFINAVCFAAGIP